MEFIQDIELVFPNDETIISAKNIIVSVKKINAKIPIYIWNKFVISPYREEIRQGNVSFFINKDYSEDVNGTLYGKSILTAIDKFREPLRNMDGPNLKKSVKYIQNLADITDMYYE